MNGVLHVKVFVAAVALLVGARVAAQSQPGQSPAPSAASNCPTVRVECPDPSFPHTIFKATVTGGTPERRITYTWSVSPGTILDGQGTPSITVEWRQSNSITATIDVSGFDARCRTSASCSIIVDTPTMPARLIARYGKIPLRAERQRLGDFAVELRNDPTARGYLITYGKDAARGRRARSYLIREHNLAPERLVALRGPSDEKTATELYVVPVGAQPPAVRKTTPVPRR